MSSGIRLTRYAKTAGCAAKLAPKTLAEVLGKIPRFYDENLLVGYETSDDAAVYRLTDDMALVQTVDFFTPVVDDPYMFGQIAAANALSDVYAMGGEPKLALNIVAFPSDLDPAILGEILAGGAAKAKEAGALLVGGHTIQDDVPKYGLCVSGIVHPQKIYKNYGSRPGDVLILTKQLGIGIMNTAIKAEMATPRMIEEVTNVMSSLNKKAKEAAGEFSIHACTDVTGFGLMGHCVEMAGSSHVTFELNVHDIAHFEDAIVCAKMGLIPSGAYRNREFALNKVDTGSVQEHYIDLLCDPQTSGGLLFSVAPEDAAGLLESLRQKQMDTMVSVIGTVTGQSDVLIRLR